MRIAVSGTHCSGKTTLIDEFLRAHPDYAHEVEAYEALQEDYGETFAANPSIEDFHRQLEFNVGRLRQYGPGDRVIFERSPADYLAYMFALADLRRDRDPSHVIEPALALARDAIPHLDIVVYLPADGVSSEESDSEDSELRSAMDARLQSILIADDLGWLTSEHPLVLEALGTTSQRLQTLEDALRLQMK